MIFYNGGSNPSAIAYNGTSLENVYFNGTLVWTRDKSETSGSGSGTMPIYDNAGNLDGYAVDVPDSVYEQQTGYDPAPDEIDNTVRFHFGPSRYANFNDLEKVHNTIYVKPDMSIIGSGAVYTGTLSTELVFDTSTYDTPTQDGHFYVFDSGTKLDAAYTSWSGIPSGLSEMPDEYRTIQPIEDVTVTCNVKLSGGGTTTRVYTGDLVFGRGNSNTIMIYCETRGDEESIAPAASGYVVQETAYLHLIYE